MTQPCRPTTRRPGVLRRSTVVATVPLAVAALIAAAGPSVARTTGASGVGDPYFPLLGNGGYHVRHYGLTLRYDPDSRHLDGTAVLTARATEDLTRFHLDLQGLDVTGLTVDAAPSAHTRDGQELVVTPRHPLSKGQKFRVTVSYQGTPEQITDPDGSPEGWVPTDDGAFVVGEPQGAMTWFPANNHPLDKASYDITVTVPEGHTAVSNGVLVGQDTTAGHSTFHWRQTEPMASYLATATVGKFEVEQYTTPDGIRVYNAVDPREAAATAPVLTQLPAVLEWGSGLFGPYPFRAAGAIVDRAPEVGYALETQTRPVYQRALRLTSLVHESAHQWFGDSVSVTTWKDIWLNEGFATYATWLYTEQHGGDSARRTFDALYAEPASDDLWTIPPGNPGSGAHIFADSVYSRGAMTLHALRERVGDPVFFRILRAWATERRAGHGTTAQFIRLAERESGRNLGTLFRTWLYTEGKPAPLPHS
ncbi:M1 family metallopeptidase [Streptomyces sp. NPDC094437]|uniref:M1 family metallopeptidase n=1 Tax=Streptomyces sp. NPDC094437 TaxID=3366060 RepID=UPI0038146224